MSSDEAVMRLENIQAEGLQQQIIFPQFYHSIGQFKGAELRQGQFFVGNAEYLHDDQFICILRGSLDIKAVPHIYRHEMYPGQAKIERDAALQTYNVVNLSVTESPVNLFEPNLDAYPFTKFIGQTYSEHL